MPSSLLFYKSTCNFFRTCPLLQEALDQAIAGDTVILCPGLHDVSSTGGLEEGGNIMGNANVIVIWDILVNRVTSCQLADYGLSPRSSDIFLFVAM